MKLWPTKIQPSASNSSIMPIMTPRMLTSGGRRRASGAARFDGRCRRRRRAAWPLPCLLKTSRHCDASSMIPTCVASLRSTTPVMRPSCITSIAVAHAEHFGHLRGDHQHGDALTGEFRDQAVDLGLRADVDAAGRLVEDQDARMGHQPAGDQHLLLIAARQVDDRLVEVGSAHPQARPLLLAKRSIARSATNPARTWPLWSAANLHVGEHVEQQEAAGSPCGPR